MLQQGFPKPAPRLMDHFEHAPDHRASQLSVQQRLVLFILSILCIHVPYAENRFNGTWSLFPTGQKDPLYHSRMIRAAGRGRGSRANGSFPRVHVGFLRSCPPAPHRISLRLAARLLRLPLKGGVIALGARASRPHPLPLAAAELQCDAAGSHPVGGNRIGQAEGEPWRRSRSARQGGRPA